MALLKKQTVHGAQEVFDTIVNFLTSNPAVPGRDWTIFADYRTLSAPYQFTRVVLRNTGKSNNENIYIGIQLIIHSAGIEAGLIWKVYYHFDNAIVSGDYATKFHNQSYGNPDGGYSCRAYTPFKTDESSMTKPPLDVWVFSNKARVIVIIDTEGRYANAYAGQYIRHMTPQEVPFPLMCWADSFNGGNGGGASESFWYSYLGYTTVDWGGGGSCNSHRQSLIFAQHGTWSFDVSNGGASHFRANRVMTPAGWSYDWRLDPSIDFPVSYSIRTDQICNYPDLGTEILLFPVYIYTYTASNSDYQVLGQLDGVYWAPNQGNTIQAEVGGGGDCIIFPNLNRTEWYSWMAIKDEL